MKVSRSSQYCRPKAPIIIPDRVAKRAGTKHNEDENGCWISTYSTASHGYAQIGWDNSGDRHMVTAHRAAWVYAHGGQIPEGMTVDHTCKVIRCVNPDHLRLMENFENARRTKGRDWEEGSVSTDTPTHSSTSSLVGNGSALRARLRLRGGTMQSIPDGLPPLSADTQRRSGSRRDSQWPH